MSISRFYAAGRVVFLFVACAAVVNGSLRAEEGDSGRTLFLQAYKKSQAGDEKSALLLYVKSADQGYRDAQFQAGFRYEAGQGVEKNLAEAIRWYTAAAKQGEPNAAFGLGRIYEYGPGEVDVDLKRSKEWYTTALKLGHKDAENALKLLGKPKSTFDAANAAHKAGNLKEALALFHKSAEEKEVFAYIFLGWAYQRGEGTEVNFAKSAGWFYKSATKRKDKRGQGLSAYELASLYAIGGDGFKQDLEKARAWLKFASERDYADAIAALKELDAGRNRFVVRSHMKRAEKLVQESQLAAGAKLYEQAAQQDDAQAALWLGRIYHRGAEGLAADASKAKQWITQAEKLGSKQAPYWLKVVTHPAGDDYLIGERLRIGFEYKWNDPTTAVHAYLRAAQQGHPAAQQAMHDVYQAGAGTFRNPLLARIWAAKAARQGDPQACWELARYYQHQFHPDKLQAIKWYRRCIELDHLVWQAEDEIKELQALPPPSGEDYFAWSVDHSLGGMLPLDMELADQYAAKGAKMGHASCAFHVATKLFNRGDRESKKQSVQYVLRVAKEHAAKKPSNDANDDDARRDIRIWELTDKDIASNLANIYYLGDGVRRDLAQAKEWSRRVLQYDPNDKNARKIISKKVWPGEAEFVAGLAAINLEGDEQTGLKHITAAANSGHRGAMKHLALSARNWDDYRTWTAKAVAAGEPSCVGIIDVLRYHDLPGAEDYRRARSLRWKKAGRPHDPARAALLYRRAADAGHPEAMGALAVLLDSGDGVPEDSDAATAMFRQAAEAGDPFSIYQYGVHLINGWGTDVDPQEGLRWLSLAAKYDMDMAPPVLARVEGQMQTPAGQRAWQGEALKTKDGSWREPQTALKHYLAAAELGSMRAKYRLGKLYLSGQLDGDHTARGIDLLIEATEEDFVNPCEDLGDLYREGKQVPQDRIAARKWYRRGIQLGKKEFAERIRDMDNDGRPGEVEFRQAREMRKRRHAGETEKMATLLIKASKLGHPDAAFLLGESYLTGDGVEQDGAAARKWLKLAADEYHGEASERLGLLLGWGIGGAADPSAARIYLTRAYDLGRDTQPYLDSLDREGYLGEEDYRAAIATMHGWLREANFKAAEELANSAAELGHHEASILLAVWRREGFIGVSKAGGYDDETEETVKSGLRRASTTSYARAETELARLNLSNGRLDTAREGFSEAFEDGDDIALPGLWQVYEKELRRHSGARHIADWKSRYRAGDEAGAREALAAAAKAGHPVAFLEFANDAIRADDDALAMKWRQKAAELGHPEGSYRLALYYFEGKGVEQDDQRGVELVRQAALQGQPSAQSRLGNCYYDGVGLEVDKAKANRWYRNGALAGSNIAAHNLGNSWYRGSGVASDVRIARHWYRQAVLNRRPNSTREEASCLFQRVVAKHTAGQDATFDAESLRLLRNAAERGLTIAQMTLAFGYETGVGVEKDVETAFKWYRAAAEYNDYAKGRLNRKRPAPAYRQAQVLAGLYERLEDYERAAEYYEQAAALGDQWAIGHLGEFIIKHKIAKLDVAVRRFKDMADFQGNPPAAILTARYSLYGVGGSVDVEQARRYAHRAYLLGYNFKLDVWDTMFQHLDHPSQDVFRQAWLARAIEGDDDKAARLYRQAAYARHPGALNRLAWLYQVGKGVPQGTERALALWVKAAELGDAASCFLLGVKYEFGRDVEKDIDQAESWYKRAHELGHSRAEEVLAGINFNRHQPSKEVQAKGWAAYQKKDLDTAEKLSRQAADAGNLEAVRQLGYIERDRGNHAQARNWFRKSMDQGNMVAPYDLGVSYRKWPDKKDEKLAIELYELAARRGLHQAQRLVAYSYQKGVGVEVDLEKAIQWYLRATKKSDDATKADTMKRLAQCFEDPDHPEFYDRTIAWQWYKKATDLGDQHAKQKVEQLGKDWHYWVVDVPKKISEEVLEAAIQHWMDGGWGVAKQRLAAQIVYAASQRGDTKAKTWIRDHRDDSSIADLFVAAGLPDIRPTRKERFAGLTKRAEAGDPGSMFILANKYIERKNWTEARKWLLEASKRGDRNARRLLVDVERKMKSAGASKPSDVDGKEPKEPPPIDFGGGVPNSPRASTRPKKVKPTDTSKKTVKQPKPTETPTKPSQLRPADFGIAPDLMKAAEAGDRTAQFVVARKYFAGKQLAEAKKWAQKSLDQKFPPALQLLNEIKSAASKSQE